MPGHNDESVEYKKRLRYEASSLWDEPSEPSFPRRWAISLVLGAAAYALYRVVQTNVLNSSGTSLSVGQRTAISVADACFMAALVPIAVWASRRNGSTSTGRTMRLLDWLLPDSRKLSKSS